MMRLILAAVAGSLFGTAFGFWFAGPGRQRGLLTGEWLSR